MTDQPKLADLKAAGQDPFRITRYDRTHTASQVVENFAALEGQTVSVAGRLISKRVMGKASFAHILDGSGSIQLYVRRDELGDEPYAEFKRRDVGDIVGAKGTVYRTQKGEISILCQEVLLLAIASAMWI